jgi:ubiquinone/menaquinone biosynthesis C-methylase UbiE
VSVENTDVAYMGEQRRLARFFAAITAEVGKPLQPDAKVLDFGCGEGAAVEAWRSSGHDAFGCDVVLDRPTNWLRLIEKPYRLPFADATFDLLVSNMVLEHVQDLDAAFREMRRVLKPGAVSLHLFPARWRPIEPHVLIPLATILQEYWWLALWARLGIRNQFQTACPWREVARSNVEYLHTRTSYRSRKQLLSSAQLWFDEVRFIEELAMKHGRRTRRAWPLVRAFPPLARFYGGLRTHFLLTGSSSRVAKASTRQRVRSLRPVQNIRSRGG